MTFRPSDDVLEQLESQQSPSLQWNDNIEDKNDWQRMFNSFWDNWNLTEEGNLSWINFESIDISSEEVKAPDLSELLRNSWEENDSFAENWLEKDNQLEPIQDDKSNTLDSDNSQNTVQTTAEPSQPNINESETKNNDEKSNNTESLDLQNNYTSPDKMPDEDRIKLVSSIPGSINSNLDYLVNQDWFNIVNKYKKIHRLCFKWWVFLIVALIGIIWWVMLQVKASNLNNTGIINESMIENKWKWIEETPDKELSILVDKGVDIDVIVPYGAVSLDWESFNSKSNLIKYNWIVLPQLASINYISGDFISLESFNEQKLKRDDIKNLINVLTKYRKTTNLANARDIRWHSLTFEWWLEGGFNLWCLDKTKVSNIVCDKYLDSFYKYGKYYDLSKYSTELLTLVKKIKKEGKDIHPICDMVKDYTLHAWVVQGESSKNLVSVMENCDKEDYDYYKKMVDFIILENSLPELSDTVFDDPDLNAYKLLSAQQNVYETLNGIDLNENYINSYLNYVQALINKDNGYNRYIHPIYKDLIYVFNMDELYQKLMKKWVLSSDLKLKINQINNWNSLDRNSVSLLSQLTISDIVQNDSSYTDIIAEDKTIEELFSQYYAMTDRLKIRKVSLISEDEIKVQTELFTEKILSVTNWETLKMTVVLHRKDNLLYIDNVKIANQPKFSEILDIYISEWDVTFYAMLNYIDEEVWMRYEATPEKVEDQPSFCDELMERDDISVYNCDNESISLYKWEIGYNFVLVDGVLNSFTVDDENLDTLVKDKLSWVMFMKDDTPAIITSIIDFSVESWDDNLEKKLDIIDQFRIHFKLVPDNIYDIKWETDKFLIVFTLWDFKLQGIYDLNTQILTKINYINCEKPVEIRQLSLKITSDNEPQLIEILNNPRVFFANANPSAYKKYQKICK